MGDIVYNSKRRVNDTIQHVTVVITDISVGRSNTLFNEAIRLANYIVAADNTAWSSSSRETVSINYSDVLGSRQMPSKCDITLTLKNVDAVGASDTLTFTVRDVVAQGPFLSVLNQFIKFLCPQSPSGTDYTRDNFIITNAIINV